MGENVKFLRLLWDIVVFRLVAYQGVLEGGGLPHYAWPPWGGLFKYYICMHFPSLGNLHSKWNCIALSQTKRLRKENIFWFTTVPFKALSGRALHKISMFPNWKTDYFYLWFLYKSDSCISCFRNDGEMKVSKVHRTCHSINGGSLEIISYEKNTKNLTFALNERSFNQYSLQCKYIFDIIIYVINPWKYRYF